MNRNLKAIFGKIRILRNISAVLMMGTFFLAVEKTEEYANPEDYIFLLCSFAFITFLILDNIIENKIKKEELQQKVRN